METQLLYKEFLILKYEHFYQIPNYNNLGGIASIVFLLWLIGYEIAINYSFNGVDEHVSYDIHCDH